MKVRVVDYQANPGGGVRFATELLKALSRSATHQFELISHGAALREYTQLLRKEQLSIPTRDIAPEGYWRSVPATKIIPGTAKLKRFMKIPGAARLKRMLGFESRWYYAVPRTALWDCDVVWFPWLHRHRLPGRSEARIVGSFHDAIAFTWPGLLAPNQVRDEHTTLDGWIDSGATIVVSSNATLGVLADALHIPPTRFTLIRVGWNHMRPPVPVQMRPRFQWLRERYILCPANTSPHKNHETLFTALGQWPTRVPVVLTGYGTDLAAGDRRGRTLRSIAESTGLKIGSSVVPLGLVSNETYHYLLAHAWAVVMPTRMEGGGSFPVMEAMLSGIPVICADIPVLREQMTEVGGRVLWFDPTEPEQLADRFKELDRHYDDWRRTAREQVSRLRVRTWRETAEEYLRVLSSGATRVA